MPAITEQTKVEFYLEGNLIMEDIASEFFKEGSLHGKNTPLKIGDVFEVIDPQEKSIKLRVMELSEGIYESGEIHTLKYSVTIDNDK
ncbi:hypothetical protein ABEY62_27550 [Priestia megaterium]